MRGLPEEPFHSPFNTRIGWIEVLIPRQQKGLSLQFDQKMLVIGSWVQPFRAFPDQLPSHSLRSDQVAIQRPVVILAQRDAIAGVIIER